MVNATQEVCCKYGGWLTGKSKTDDTKKEGNGAQVELKMPGIKKREKQGTKIKQEMISS